MFKKILVANRGEIAVRIMATCHEMGIQTVAVYSEADRDARHVREATSAYLIGPASAAQSYLCIEKIIDVAKQSGAEAIHPGYGFLSENVAFVEACEDAGVTFIGPPARAMRLMGSKIAAKRLAQSLAIPTVPGYRGDSQDDATLLDEAQRIGFPLLIKASAGGGGKGMREVHTAADFFEQLAGAKREALAAFGNETVFLERLIQRPRHVEIQILADRYGHTIHLGERECSIQRRHQKIVEESPSVMLTSALRAEMGSAAVRLAQAAGYVNAGTMEFLLDADKQYYFLEMNTRLQVEHPVTELVTGLDLVRHQLLVAAGEPLGLTQEQIQQRGHAIEARIYAEDAERDFLPSTGKITRMVKPEGPGIRVDSGIESADEITQFYDPMIAKLIVSAEDRPAAMARLQRALEHYAIFGVTTNIPLLHAIAVHPAFQEGLTHTSFLDEYHLTDKHIAQSAKLPAEVLMAAAVQAVNNEIRMYNANSTGVQTNPTNPWKTLGPWRMLNEARIISCRYGQQEHKVALKPIVPGTWSIQLEDGIPERITVTCGIDNLVLLTRDTEQVRAYVQQYTDETQVMVRGQLYHLAHKQPPSVETSAGATRAASAQRMLTAPMAGTIIKVQVHDGDSVQAQQVLVILSAMKMEHAITAPYNGTVQHVYYQEGAVVRGGDTLVEMQ
ncbi:MAG: acetyl-CoA carboxylase biotin carboxylase subunit [Ktedonobacteraceae bacterium]|nr:acetyl-CoA carboxylase biotin carboxylase subunit [Ktedonobacteraceae bacterium]